MSIQYLKFLGNIGRCEILLDPQVSLKSLRIFADALECLHFAVTVVVGWIFTGAIFNFSDTWQLVINTGTTIITFLMVFLIQNTQNRDTETIQLKLDELIRATKGAHNALLDLKNLKKKVLINLKRDIKH